jgi:hypothetical protein
LTWDYSFFIPKNNLFRKEGLIHDLEDMNMLLVTEVNRCIPCSTCSKSVGDVSNMFCEINAKYYCAPCGYKLGGTSSEKELPEKRRRQQALQML